MTAAEERAEKTREGWERKGLQAAPEMIAAVCKRDDLLASGAREVLIGLGPAALPSLARASAEKRCDLGGVIADIVCGSGKGEADLLAMLRDKNAHIVRTALYLLAHIGSERQVSRCQRAAPVVKRVTPELRPLLRGRTGRELQDVLWAAEGGGTDAVSLVPDVMPLLDQDEVTGNFAAAMLGAVGTGAQSAVPALRARLRRGGRGTQSSVSALGGIGPAARPALLDFAPLLERALPQLCSTVPRYSEADALTQAIARATSAIGGTEAEPLVPHMVTAFHKMRACGLIAGTYESWLEWFAALGTHGRAAEPALLAIVEDADERVDVRRRALAVLDVIGSPLGSWWSLRAIRKALDRKRDIFEGRGGMPPMQILPPPPRTPPEFALCREEAGLPPLPEPPELAVKPEAKDRDAGWATGQCLRRRLCGPDESAYRKTMANCCANAGATPPWFCTAFSLQRSDNQ